MDNPRPYKRIKSGQSSVMTVPRQNQTNLRSMITTLMGDNFNAANYATVSVLVMIAVVFMFQTDIIRFQEAINGLNSEQISDLTSALGGPINQAGINVDEYTRNLYQQIAANMDIPVANIADLVNGLVERNTVIQELLPAGWTFPAIYSDETFPSVLALGERIMSDSSAPIFNLFNSILDNLRTVLGLPSMNSIVDIISNNSVGFVASSPRLEPVRAYYFAILNLVNGDGNLFRDLQNISTITAFNQYANMYSGVFIALMYTLRNTISLASGVVRGANGVITFVIGEDLYASIMSDATQATQTIVRSPFQGSFHLARFIIFQMNRLINNLVEFDSPLDIFAGIPNPPNIPDNFVVIDGNPGEISMTIDSTSEYNLLREIGDFAELYILKNDDFLETIERFSQSATLHNIREALDLVLVPSQNIESSQESQVSIITSSSRSSRSSINYGDSTFRISVLLQHMLSYIFTTSVFLTNPSQSADTFLTELNEDIGQDEMQSTVSSISSDRQSTVSGIVGELLESQNEVSDIIDNVTQVVITRNTSALQLLHQYDSPTSSNYSSQGSFSSASMDQSGGSRSRKRRRNNKKSKTMKIKKAKTKKIRKLKGKRRRRNTKNAKR